MTRLTRGKCPAARPLTEQIASRVGEPAGGWKALRGRLLLTADEVLGVRWASYDGRGTMGEVRCHLLAVLYRKGCGAYAPNRQGRCTRQRNDVACADQDPLFLTGHALLDAVGPEVDGRGPACINVAARAASVRGISVRLGPATADHSASEAESTVRTHRRRGPSTSTRPVRRSNPGSSPVPATAATEGAPCLATALTPGALEEAHRSTGRVAT